MSAAVSGPTASGGEGINSAMSKLNVNTNVSDHTAVTTSLQDENDHSNTPASLAAAAASSVNAAGAENTPVESTASTPNTDTPGIKTAADTPTKAVGDDTPPKAATAAASSKPKKKSSIRNVDLVLGEWVAEGGFCSIYEVSTIQDNDTKEWILGGPQPTTLMSSESMGGSSKRHSRNRAKSFTSLTPLSPRKHTRGQSTSAVVQGTLPPLMKTVHMSVSRPFHDNQNATSSTTDLLDSGSARELNDSGSQAFSPRKSGLFRRSHTIDTTSTPTAAATPTNVHPSFLKKSPSRKDTSFSTTTTTGPSFVLKCLKNPVLQNPEVLDLGLKDMKIEIQMLQRLRHNNIIGLRAYGSMVLDTSGEGGENKQKPRMLRRAPTAYPFVVLDRLGSTLEDKFKYWENQHHKKSSIVGKLVTHRHHSKQVFCGHERWQVLCDMSSALAYLHKHRIIYRDVKPENVAFDQNTETLKLLDFGLAKDLSGLQPSPISGLYRLTGLTGSARYMAPEVAREDEYNDTCDVYGLAIVMWQVMALETPYSKFNVNKMFKFVYDCPHVRPPLDEWKKPASDHSLGSPTLQLTDDLEWFAKLLSRMWSPLIEKRPAMKEVHLLLKKKLEQYRKAAEMSS